ncbi:uncharacterized protein N0V89_004100 [Didymosphaeria variabile]|uniref:Uncharacterized protein n=1 Tax=Didymosphaeria variabile TaxID=1932322 RepID=A0A9W8XRI6_9PLEO|nr:uncharacterized protein N0V89_004100 [Didymosphaeria variabile]KAJ4356073.1 hypothetical protein N0V89_004100 [Didymosphaeria variabile]
MPQFRTTKIAGSYRSTTIPLFWFVQADDEQRKNTGKALNEIVDYIVKQKPHFKRKHIVSVPWLRNYAPSLADIFVTARGFEMGEGHVLGIDAQSLEDKTLLVLHCVNEKEPEIGRVAREDAIAMHLREQHLFRYTLAEAFGERPWARIPVPMRNSEPEVEDDDIRYTLPSHIPSDTKLEEENITLFSLIQLTDKEILALRQDMSDTTNEITIYNWPHDTPASQAETYNIFQCVKPDRVAPCGQTFVMFIDATHISGPERAPVVVVACESRPDGIEVEGRYSKQDRMRYEHIYLRAEEAKEVKHLWPLIWHPPNRGSVNDVVVNYPLFYGSSHRFVSNVPTPAPDWKSPVTRYQDAFIAKPGAPIWATGAKSPNFVVYVVCPVTSEELRYLRSIVREEIGDAVQFLELNLVTRELRPEREIDTSSQESFDHPCTPLDPLLVFFDSPKYRAIADPPSTFVFLDNNALDNLLNGAKNGSVPLAHSHHHFHRAEGDTGGLVAVEEPAYLYADISIDEGLESTLANLEVGNMWFWELAGMYSDNMGVAFWPEYKGSMTRDMLNIEEF